MKINIDNFTIESDDLQYIIYENKTYGKDAKRPGDSYRTVLGYYRSVEQCLEAIMNLNIRRSNAETLQALKQDIYDIKDIINNWLE